MKVDRSFIRDIAMSSEDKAITVAIIAMSRALSETVVAAGEETADYRTTKLPARKFL